MRGMAYWAAHPGTKHSAENLRQSFHLVNPPEFSFEPHIRKLQKRLVAKLPLASAQAYAKLKAFAKSETDIETASQSLQTAPGAATGPTLASHCLLPCSTPSIPITALISI